MKIGRFALSKKRHDVFLFERSAKIANLEKMQINFVSPLLVILCG